MHLLSGQSGDAHNVRLKDIKKRAAKNVEEVCK